MQFANISKMEPHQAIALGKVRMTFHTSPFGYVSRNHGAKCATMVTTALDDLLTFYYDRCIYCRHLSPPNFVTQDRFRGQGVKGYLKIGLP